MSGNFLGNCLCSLLGAGVFIAGCTILLVTAFPIVQIAIGAAYMYECPTAPVIPVYVMVSGMLTLLILGLFALPKLLCPAAPGHRIWTVWILSLVLLFLIWFLYGNYQVYSIYPPNYIQNSIDPNIFNNSVSAHTAPDNKLGLTVEEQNQSLSNLNQTWMTDNKQTLKKLMQTLALSNISREQIKGTHPNTTERGVMSEVPYCDRTVYLFAFWTTTLVYVFAGNALLMIICLYAVMTMTDKFLKYFTT
ncbi:hypothetical protein L3Q82_020829 [Scortum barcoo]|uniref:Uncharacterized protein n=1 Tax=Scortum barcoo TaxID=214431 RepID=A0ACB8VBV2_9TELE|nr:hypothetical protein L3Q82_020829 [Scortum barcoo]